MLSDFTHRKSESFSLIRCIQRCISNSDEQIKVTSNPEKCSYDSECHLNIEFPDQGITLDLTLKHNSSRIYGYWEWSDLTIEGTVKGTPISASGNGHMEIHPKGTGFTHKDVDINCE